MSKNAIAIVALTTLIFGACSKPGSDTPRSVGTTKGSQNAPGVSGNSSSDNLCVENYGDFSSRFSEIDANFEKLFKDTQNLNSLDAYFSTDVFLLIPGTYHLEHFVIVDQSSTSQILVHGDTKSETSEWGFENRIVNGDPILSFNSYVNGATQLNSFLKDPGTVEGSEFHLKSLSVNLPRNFTFQDHSLSFDSTSYYRESVGAEIKVRSKKANTPGCSLNFNLEKSAVRVSTPVTTDVSYSFAFSVNHQWTYSGASYRPWRGSNEYLKLIDTPQGYFIIHVSDLIDGRQITIAEYVRI